MFDDLLGRTTDAVLPVQSSDSELAQNFVDFFEEKINNIYSSFNGLNDTIDLNPPELPLTKLTDFKAVHWDDYNKMVKIARKSYCAQDPLPIGASKKEFFQTVRN